MRAPLLPATWVTSQGVNVSGAPRWVTTSVTPDTVPNAAFSTAPDNILDNRLDTPALPGGPDAAWVYFENNYNLESGADGAVIEVSHPGINGGAFTDITDPAVAGSVTPGYNALITSASSPIAGRMAWTGNSGGYLSTVVNLGNAMALPNDGRKLRFRLVTDNSGASAGWRIDNVYAYRFECPSPAPSPSPTPTATPIASPCGSPNIIADSTFEAGTPWSNWTVQTSTNFGTPLCNRAVCGTDGGSPYAGDNWAWFGGANVPETATLGQSVPIMAGGTATLSFVLKIRAFNPPPTDVLNVRVDGTIVQSYPEGGQFEGDYSMRTIDLSAFADGGSHLILFEYIGPTTGLSSYLVDNVFLTFGPACSSPTPTPTLTATPSATPTPTPSPTVTATPPPTPTPSPTATPSLTPAQALNISTRLRVETGDRVMIGGFIVTGNAPKRVALRGLGPSLNNAGLTGLLADPTLELRGNDGALLAQNDDWQDDPEQAGQLTALGLAPQNPNESGIVATLDPGAYTALMAGKNQTTGLGLVEIYDADAASASQLANLSTRGFVQTANNVMIGGFILGHNSGRTDVVIRGRGPSLSQFGLNNVLADPTLELRDANGALLIANDNWQDDPISAAQLTARGFALPHPLESGIFASLSPGAFTAILAGKNGGVGLGLVEIYSGVGGSTLTVTNTADSGAGSLRAAIAAASNGDTIQFDAALNGQTINLTSGELVIDKNITIAGPGPSLLAVSRDSNSMATFRIFHVTPGHTSTIEGLMISGNHANPPGGGVFNEATLTINNCRLDHNFSEGNGGGILNGGTLTIRNSSVSGSAAGALPLSTTGNGGGISNSGTLDISKSAIFGNEANFWGGGISNSGTVTITDCTVRGNLTGSEFVLGSGFGGGISNQDSGTLTIRNSTVSGNVSNGNFSGGGGIFSGSGNTTLVITNSTISGNFAHPKGGGILNGGSLTVTHSTVSGNSIQSPGNGGAIHNNGGMVQIGNTILQTGAPGVSIFNNAGTITSHGYNLSSDNGGGFLTAIGDQINTDPILGPLQDNGGPTFTHELLTGSPAINAGDPSFTPPPLYDQRGPGYDRVIGGRIDAGSFELQP
jgi:hypothetical protein